MAGYVISCLVTLLSISMFIAPFYGWYWYYKRPHIRSLAGFNASLEQFFSSRPANWLVFTWAAAEAVVWFVIPEFLLILAIFMRVHRKKQMLLYDIYGTVAGTLAAMLLSFRPEVVERLPYIQPGMVKLVQGWYDSQGVLALFHQPLSGVPYKVFTHLAVPYHMPIVLFLLLAITVRLARYLIIYGVGVAAYPALHRYVERNYLYLYVGTVFVFSILLYKVYLGF